MTVCKLRQAQRYTLQSNVHAGNTLSKVKTEGALPLQSYESDNAHFCILMA